MRGRLFALLPQSRLFARFYSELNVSMQCAHNPRVVTTLGGDVTISACGTLAKCFMVMERVPFTLGNFLRKEGSKMTVIKSLEIVTEKKSGGRQASFYIKSEPPSDVLFLCFLL